MIYGFGDTGLSLTTTIIGVYFLMYLTDVVGLSPGIAALAIFVGRSWDYINDPIFGHLSDRTRTRWGRRRPYLLFGALPFALAFSLLWWRPPMESVGLLALYYALAYVLFDTAATMLYMPYFALTPELTSDYDERTSLTTYRMFFSILGSLVAFTIPLMMIGAFNPASASRVLTMGLTFGVVSAAPFILVFFGTRERSDYIPPERTGLRKSLRIAFRNKPYVFGLLIFLLTWVAVEIVQATLLFFIKYVVHREPESDLIMSTIFVTAILVLPVWAWVSRRWSKRIAYIGGIGFWAFVQLLLISLNISTPLSILLTLCVLAGVGVAAAHVLPWAILPDAVEWGEWQYGERNEGMLYSLVTLIRKVTTSLAVPMLGVLLEITGYQPNVACQPDSALLGIRIAMGPIPAIILCGGIFFALRYPLSREEHARIVRELDQKRNLKIKDSL